MWINAVLLSIALILTVVAVGIFVSAAKAGHFEDVEEAKFTMLRSEEDQAARRGANR